MPKIMSACREDPHARGRKSSGLIEIPNNVLKKCHKEERPGKALKINLSKI